VTGSGARATATVPYHRGHWKNPMTDQEIEAKFRGLASGLLTSVQADAVLERLWNLDQVKDIGEVIKIVKRS